jgi:hypothetical protein
VEREDSVPELPLTAAEQDGASKRGPARRWLPRFSDIVQSRSSEMPADDAAAVVDEAVPVVRDDVLLDLHRAFALAKLDVSARPTRRPPGFRDAGLLNGQIGGFYNFVAFVAAFAMVPFTRRLRRRRPVHAVCLVLCRPSACGRIPSIRDKAWLFVPMLGVGLAWGSASWAIRTCCWPAAFRPKARRRLHGHLQHVHRGADVDPNGDAASLLPESLLGGDPANVIRLAGTLLHVRRGLRAVRATPAPENPSRMKNQVQLITYVDRFGGGGLADLQAGLLTGPLAGVFGGVHLLPFFHPIDGSRCRLRPDRPHAGRCRAWATGTTSVRWRSTWT